jgi:hypothetical protein
MERMIVMNNLLQTLRDTYLTNSAAALSMLPEICKAIDEGLIIELPCKVGDEIYFNDNKSVQKGVVTDFDVTKNDITPITGWSCGEAYFRYEYSLIRESAEKKLEDKS